MTALGRVVGRCVSGFRADVLVVGGSMSASWDLLAPAFRAGAEGSGLPRVVLAAAPTPPPSSAPRCTRSRDDRLP